MSSQGVGHTAILRDGKAVASVEKDCAVGPVGRTDLSFEIAAPENEGSCRFVAELRGAGRKLIRSRRDVRVAAGD